MSGASLDADLSVWLKAPKERTAAYFPTYSAVAKQMQAAMRRWTCEWFYANQDVLKRPYAAQTILVYICTHPFRGKRTNTFTYDVHAGMLDAALRSAASTLGAELKALRTEHLEWNLREIYFDYRSDAMVDYVRKNRAAFVRMLNVETSIMDRLLKFAVVDLHSMGFAQALALARKNIAIQLGRFSTEVNLRQRADDLLRLSALVLADMNNTVVR